jgi:hypothetical protein
MAIIDLTVRPLAAGDDETEFAVRPSVKLALSLSNESIGEGWPARKLTTAPAIPPQADRRLAANSVPAETPS